MQPNEKYMFDTLVEKSLLAGDNLFDIGHQICQKMQATQDVNVKTRAQTSQQPDEEVVSVFDSLVYPDTASQQVVTCVGRICSDAETKINPNSTLLVSTDDTKLRSVRLNFSNIKFGRIVCRPDSGNAWHKRTWRFVVCAGNLLGA